MGIRLRSRGIFLLILWCCAHLAFAQDAPLKVDVRLVIDVSGSMKRNDPEDLRQPAVDLLVRLLPPDSRAGIWTFGKFVNMLVPHQVVDEQWRRQARQKASEINSVGLFTNIGEALEKAAHDVDSLDGNYATSILLLTDGMVDISKDPQVNQDEWRRIVDKVIPKLKEAGITVHTIALSDHADNHLLEKLALATDGTAAVAKSAEELMAIFLKAFDVAAPSQQVPLANNSFAVDSSVEEFTALIFRQQKDEQTQLIGPDKQVYNSTSSDRDVNWHRDKDYDLITVKQPLEGEWQVQAAIAPASRITVVSDLRLKVKTLASNLFRGGQESLSFVVQEDGKTIVRKEFLSLLHNTAKMGFGPRDEVTEQLWNYDFSQYSPPSNGIYSVKLPLFKQMGVYDVDVLVDGKTFQRRFHHRITVREPFTASLDESTNDSGQMVKVLTVRSHNESINPKKTQIAATIVNPAHRRSVKPLGLTQFDHWQTLIHTDQVGDYNITVQITGEDESGEVFEYSLSPMAFHYDPDAAFASVVAEPVVELPAEKPPLVEEAIVPVAEPKVEPKPEASAEPVVSEAVEPAATPSEDESGIPAWLLYVVLALGNLAILGGGYFLFRKLMTDNGDEVLAQYQETPAAPESAKTPPEPTAEEEEELMTMDDADDDEEEPPMEDLDPVDIAEFDGDAEDESLSDAADDGGDMEEDDFGVDDLEDEATVDETEANDDEQDADLAAEMLKAQGLDLAEDELDDAITNLIDELDGARPEAKKNAASDFDDFDFGEDDDK